MHVIAYKRIKAAQQRFPNSASALEGWYRVIKRDSYKNFSELKSAFNSVDKVGSLHVFNIGGNKLRIIANIDFMYKKVFIRDVLSHHQYDQNNWLH